MKIYNLLRISHTDFRGFAALFAVILLIIVVDILSPKFFYKPRKFDNSKFSAQIDTFISKLDTVEQNNNYQSKYDTLKLFNFNPNSATKEQFEKLGLSDKQIKIIENYRNKGGKFETKEDFAKIYGIPENQYKKLEHYIVLPENKIYVNNQTELFDFDPNIATIEDFKKLGLSEKQANTIINFRNKGGKFYKKEDFKKMYCINQETYDKLESHIVINTANMSSNNVNINKQKQVISTIEINSADTNVFMQLPGIGSSFARRIVLYRQKLGGYYSIEQIKEVYGMKPEVYNQIAGFLTVDASKIKKININFAEYTDLIKHPYIDKVIANGIRNYISQNGFFTSPEQLKQFKIVTEQQYNKLKYYLIVE